MKKENGIVKFIGAVTTAASIIVTGIVADKFSKANVAQDVMDGVHSAGSPVENVLCGGPCNRADAQRMWEKELKSRFHWEESLKETEKYAKDSEPLKGNPADGRSPLEAWKGDRETPKLLPKVTIPSVIYAPLDGMPMIDPFVPAKTPGLLTV